MEIRWTASELSNGCYVIQCLLSDDILPGMRNELLTMSAREFSTLCEMFDLPADALLGHVIALAPGIPSRDELASVALTKSVGRQRAVERKHDLSRFFLSVLAYQRCEGDLVAKLRLRTAPIQELWEARGPGVLRQIALITEDGLIAPAATIVVVQPIRGGGGRAFHAHNCVALEGVLANPVAALPEVVRLAWLLAQLQQDLPAYSERLKSGRFETIAGLALIPPALAAARELELASCDVATCEQAIAAWMPQLPDARRHAGAVWQWWETYQDRRVAWPVALAALEAMVNTTG